MSRTPYRWRQGHIGRLHAVIWTRSVALPIAGLATAPLKGSTSTMRTLVRAGGSSAATPLRCYSFAPHGPVCLSRTPSPYPECHACLSRGGRAGPSAPSALGVRDVISYRQSRPVRAVSSSRRGHLAASAATAARMAGGVPARRLDCLAAASSMSRGHLGSRRTSAPRNVHRGARRGSSLSVSAKRRVAAERARNRAPAEVLVSSPLAPELGWTETTVGTQETLIDAIANAMCDHLGFDRGAMDATQVRPRA